MLRREGKGREKAVVGEKNSFEGCMEVEKTI